MRRLLRAFAFVGNGGCRVESERAGQGLHGGRAGNDVDVVGPQCATAKHADGDEHDLRDDQHDPPGGGEALVISPDDLQTHGEVEQIIDKVIELVKGGKIKEISDIRDETGLEGLKITIDLKRGVDPDKLMRRLYKLTPLEDSYACNFNVLIGGVPMVLGVKQLLNEWIAFRIECVRRRTYFDLNKKKDKLHLLKGLEKILLDILEPNIYKEVKGFLFSKNIEFIKDYRLIQGGM